MRRRLLLILVVMALAVTCAFNLGDTAPQPPSKYDHFLNSVVVVRSSEGEGAGFFVNPHGLLVTNKHVVQDDDEVTIITRGGKKLIGTVNAVDDILDLALVSIPEKSPDWLPLARPNEGGVGADVIAIGTARGLSWSVSKGIISGLRDGKEFDIGMGRDVMLIQTDAAINPGNSGGPLILVESGNVIGVNTITFKKHIAEGISFAISADNVRVTLAKFQEPKTKPADPNQAPVGKEQEAKDRLKSWIANPTAAIARLAQRSEPEKKSTTTADLPITLANPKTYTIANQKEGELLVVTGRAKNDDRQPHSYIALKGTIHDAQGKVLITKTVYSGNFLTDKDLESLPMAEIERRLNNRSGNKNSNINVQPGKSVNFMVVFNRIPPQAEEWYVGLLSADQ